MLFHFTPCILNGYLRYILFAAAALVVVGVRHRRRIDVRVCVRVECCSVHCTHIQTQFDAIACYFNTNRDASIKTYLLT